MITNLSDGPADVPRSGLRVWQHTTSGVVEAEVGSTVDDDTLDGYTESSVQTDDTVTLEDLTQTITQAPELTLTGALADISSQTTVWKIIVKISLCAYTTMEPTGYGRSQAGRRSTAMWLQPYHRRPGYR